MRIRLLPIVSGIGLFFGSSLCAANLYPIAAPQVPQSVQSTSAPKRTLPSVDGRDGDPDDPNAIVRQAQMARLQNNDRQKRIVDDTAKLLRLATELKADVDKSNKDQMSLEVIRKADEVERLAHDVKIRMRG